MNLENKERLLFIAMILVGIGFIIWGFKESLEFKNNGIEIEAIVKEERKYTDSDDKEAYKLKVSYYVDNKEYIGTITSSSRIKVGGRIKIYYDKNNPKDISTTNIKSEGLGIIFLGIIFCIVGLKLLKK